MEDDGIFCGHLVHFTAIWYMLWTFDIFCGNLVYIFPCWYFALRKIWQHSAMRFQLSLLPTSVARFLLVCDIPNGGKIYQLTTNHMYSNFFSSKALKNLPKLRFLVCKYTIWQPCFHRVLF
jgi:hypothetical protein